MSFLDKLSTLIPFSKKEEMLEYYFALNISLEKLTAALWLLEGKELKILETASASYNSNNEIATVTDRLLDQVLGLKEIEPQKILFGVPNSWLIDENLKDEYLKLLRNLVKQLELTPMAYVATAHAIVHFLEKTDGVPTTAILLGFEKHHLAVTVVRAGKLDGVKIINRGENSGTDVEKALLTFTDVETLPSKILIYGLDKEALEKLKSQLLSFSWMSKLSFLHFPKIDILGEDLEIKSICLAGGSEINSSINYTERPIQQSLVKEETESEDESEPKKEEALGFIVGDVSSQLSEESTEIPVDQDRQIEIEDFESQEQDVAPPLSPSEKQKKGLSLERFIPKSFTNMPILFGIISVLVLLIGAYLFLPKVDVKIFVEPKILEKDAQVIADPKQSQVNEDAKIIPAQVVDTEVSGSAKDSATGKKQIGDPAKGTIVIYNKTYDSKSISKGTVASSSNGLKFTLDTSVTVASQSATDSGITFGKANTTVTASAIGADSNLPSGSEMTISGFSSSQISAKAEGNFSGGTSKEVTVISDADQKRLLAVLASDLRRQAQQKLQDNFPGKKILEEALSEEILKKNYSKNINDQANEFSLNLTVKFKGTAFEDKDLKLIVSKLVTTQVPDGFQLDLTATETQADVSKLEKDGKLVFLARFKAKLIPKIDIDKIKNQIKFKTPGQVADILKGMENVLGSEIKFTPNLPKILQRLPLLTKNIKIEVGLK